MKNSNFQIKEALEKVSAGKSKKILFACVPADGHFNPLTGIAKHLQAEGYEIGWYCSSTYGDKIKKLAIRHFPFNKALDVNGENLEEVFPERREIKNPVKKLNFDIIRFFISRGPEYYADLLEIKSSFNFDLVIADCAFTGIPFITDKMHIPVVSIGVFPLTETSKDTAPNGLGKTPADNFIGKRMQALSRFIANKILFREANKVLKDLFKEYGMQLDYADLFDVLVKKSTLLLQSGTPGFEYYRSDLSPTVRFIGPLLPYTSTGHKDQWFDERLLSYQRVLLVTQGTVEKDVEKLLVPTLEAYKNTDTLVVATTGGSQTAALKARFPENNIIIEDFIRFEDVMPYSDVYITNGGYGGVMLAIQNKLPMVVAGVHEGKNEINARIGYFNLGVNLKTETPSVLQVRSAVEEIFSNDTYRNSVIKLEKEFSQYDPLALCSGYVKEILENKAVLLTRKEKALAF